MTTIYLIRHCEAAGNIQRVFQGHMDADITPNGALQLDHLAERFKDVSLDAIYSSPLLRARRTAEAVNRHHHLPIQTDDRLMEINGGVWEGKPWASLPARCPLQSRKWLKKPWDFHPRKGEAMRQVYARMGAALSDIAAAHPGQAVAVASHGCAIRNALCWAKGWPIERLNDEGWCDNTAVSVLEFDEAGRVRVVSENDNSHLSGEVSTFAKQTWWKTGKLK